MKRGTWFRSLLLAALAAMAVTAPIRAQAQTGNVFGTVVDDKGQPLPGVTLTLSGVGAPQVQISDAQGQFRFPGLSPASYKLEASLESFSSVVFESVVVNLNRNTTLAVTLQPAVEETITVTAESPVLDTRKITTGATIDKNELEKIPTARDPWVMLQTTPGVLIDRVNVGGNESGQQSGYVGNGSAPTTSTWQVDGVDITDLGATGSSPAYYDFDAFEEIQISTGGSDAANRTGGVGINLVTKRGTNEWRGSGRYLVDDQSWQSNSSLSSGDFGRDYDGSGPVTGQKSFTAGNRIVKVVDDGLELGGPLVKDRLWIWGSYGKQDIKLKTVSSFNDNTQIEDYSGKINGQLGSANSATFFFFQDNKTKQGRSAGPTRPQETSWDQTGPTKIYKLEDSEVFGSNFFLTGMASKTDQGFSLTPEGGVSDSQFNTSLDSAFVAHNTYLAYDTGRPAHQLKADGSYFFSTGSINHELKFGANYRHSEVTSLTRWPGYGIDLNYYQSFGYGFNVVQVTRDGGKSYAVDFKNGYVQDTLTTDRLTANLGLRYDVQTGKNLAHNLRANPVRPDLEPAVRYHGGDAGFDWKTLSPKLGLTWALGAEKKTLLRASYARFADQLSGIEVSQTNPLYPGAYVYLYYDDRNGDAHAQPSELLPGILFNNGSYNPEQPGQPLASFAVDPRLKAPTSDELVLGVEHALLPEFVVGFNFTYRQVRDIEEFETLVFDGDAFASENLDSLGRPHKASDYVLQYTAHVTQPDGSVRDIPVYGLRPGVTTRGGTLLQNGDREQRFLGASLTFNKRLSNRWMARGNVSWRDWTWKVPDSENESGNFRSYAVDSKDGEQVVTCAASNKTEVCISGRWSYSLSGLYQVAPDQTWGFNLAASLNGHEGYSLPYFARLPGRAGFPEATWDAQATAHPGDFKDKDVHVMDLRLEKEFHFDRFGLTLGLDAFNVLNVSTVLQRNLRLGRTNSNYITEVVSPRIFRLGARFSFN
jgi:hypothetical protein